MKLLAIKVWKSRLYDPLINKLWVNQDRDFTEFIFFFFQIRGINYSLNMTSIVAINRKKEIITIFIPWHLLTKGMRLINQIPPEDIYFKHITFPLSETHYPNLHNNLTPTVDPLNLLLLQGPPEDISLLLPILLLTYKRYQTAQDTRRVFVAS